MRHRISACASVLAAALGVVWLPLAGQDSAPAVKAAQKAKPAAQWTAPRTPWGDPDIQGWFTNVYEDGTPLERPDQFAGRRLEDVTGEELAKIRRGIQERTLRNFEGPIHGPDGWWQDKLFLEKGSQAWLVVDPPDGRIPPLTPQAKQRAADRAEARRKSGRGPADSWEDRSLYDRCITRGLPGSMMPAIYGNSYQIVQTPGYVAIRYEMVNETRVIATDGRAHHSPSIRRYMGDPVGRWEGDTLVVETTNFRENAAYRNANAATLRVIERFTRVAPAKVRWSVTLDDPETWTRPWTFSMPLTENDEEQVLEYACHEGNYGLRNILSGARADEKRAAEEAARRKGGAVQ
jgi:hypothetical protein